MKFAALLLSVLALTVAAQATPKKKVTCDVHSIRDAQACMEKVAVAYQSYEEPNDGYAVADTQRLVEVLSVLGVKGVINKAKKADYAGFMIEHGDEHHIYYFAINKGKKVSPVELYDFNIVDIGLSVKKPWSKAASDPSTYILHHGPARKSDVVSDLEAQIEDVKNNE
jgi:predicted SPOUT superfamily RNA methylase MTH1